MVPRHKSSMVWLLPAIPVLAGGLLFLNSPDVKTGLFIVGGGVVCLGAVGWALLRGRLKGG